MGKGVLRHKTDVKIFILFLLNNVRCPLTLAEISELVLADGFVAEFDFAECFSELCELGHILSAEEDGEERFLISPTGCEASAELEDTLVAGLRKRSLQTAMRFLSLRRRGARIDAIVMPREGGRYTVTCTTSDKNGEIASFSLTFPSRGVAEQIRTHFLEKPDEVVRAITGPHAARRADEPPRHLLGGLARELHFVEQHHDHRHLP